MEETALKRPISTDLALSSSLWAGNDTSRECIIIGNPQNAESFHFFEHGFNTGFIHFLNRQKTQDLLITTIRNLIRKTNITEMNEELNNGEIDESEYYKRLDNNEDKYVITLRDLASKDEAILIALAVDKIGYDLRDFSTSDISEMFGVREDHLLAEFNYSNHLIKKNG